MAGKGMSATIGRLRPCSILGWKFELLSHNTIRGAAGGTILLAELCVAKGLVRGLSAPSNPVEKEIVAILDPAMALA